MRADAVASVELRITPEEQQEDQFAGPVYKLLKDGDRPRDDGEAAKVERSAEDCILQDGLLYRLWIDVSGRRCRDAARPRFGPKSQLWAN